MVTDAVYTDEYLFVTRTGDVETIHRDDLVLVEALTRCDENPSKLLEPELWQPEGLLQSRVSACFFTRQKHNLRDFQLFHKSLIVEKPIVNQL